MELFKKYPYKVRIFQMKGGVYYVINDVGRRYSLKSDGGTERLKLRKMKVDLPFPDHKFVYLTERGLHMIDYFSPTEGEYEPLGVQKVGEILERHPVDKDILLWGALEKNRIEMRYRKEESIWSKLMPLLLAMMTIVAVIGGVIFIYDGQVKVMNAGSTSNNAYVENMKIAERVADKLDLITSRLDGLGISRQVIGQSNATAPPF